MDLFSGIGGFSLGLERAGMTTVGFCEIEPFPRAVLRKHWPDVWIHDDVRTLSGDLVRERCGAVDLICGGFPCQDVSRAGLHGGIEASRSGLWREYWRLIGELRPRFAVVENTPGLLERGLGRVLGDLAEIGYDAEWSIISACSVGAPHTRERLFIVAHPNGQYGKTGMGLVSYWQAQNEAKHDRSSDGVWVQAAARTYRMVNGIPGGMDRITALGNSVVPAVIEQLGRVILAAS